MTTGNTAIGQTFFQLISSMGNVNQDWDTTTASGDGAFALNDANLSGTQIVMGDNDGQMVNGSLTDSVVGDNNDAAIDNDGSAVNFGNGVAAEGENVNLGGEQYNVQDSNVEESAFGHSQVQSNDMDFDLDDGSAVALGGDAHAANVDAKVMGNDGNVAIQAGEDNAQNQLNDESTDLDFDFDLDVDDHTHNGDTNTIQDSFQVDDSFNPFSHNDVDNDLFDIA